MTTIQELNWTNLENISKPISSLKIKAFATVLTQKGVGTVLCPKCNILNIVRDSKLECYCGFTRNIIDCACGECKQQLLDRDRWGNSHSYIIGHDRIGDKHHGWKGGRYKNGDGYWMIRMPNHPRANNGYVFEHIVIYENYHKCCILPWIHVHHDDKDIENNHPDNLVLVTCSKHGKLRKKDCGQICKCGSIDVIRDGFSKNGKQTFLCNNCGSCWVLNKTKNIESRQATLAMYSWLLTPEDE
jgi:hypothetical protein